MKITNLKKWLMIVVIGLMSQTLSAHGPYINLNLGYGFGTSTQNVFGFYNQTRQGAFTTYEQVNVSFGQGLNMGGAIGYMFNKNVGAELGISYQMGGESTVRNVYNNGTTDYTYASNMIRFNPSVVIEAGFEKINPYAKFGMIIGTGSIVMDYNDNDDGDVWMDKTVYNGGIALGLSAGLGVLFSLSENVGIFGELNMVNLSYSPTKGEVTEASYNGTDQLSSMTTKERHTDFVESYTTEQGNPSPDSEPNKQLLEKYPYGSFGINLGVKIRF